MKKARLVPGFFNGSIDRFCGVLNRLRPPRKELDRQAEEMAASLKMVEDRLRRQIRYEEGSLFPFVTAHVPRLEGVVACLLSENQDLRRLVKDLRLDLATLRAMESLEVKLVRKIRSEGAYLSCLLRSHLWLQERTIYDTMPRQLKPHEKASFDEIRSLGAKTGRRRGHGRDDRAAVGASSVL